MQLYFTIGVKAKQTRLHQAQPGHNQPTTSPQTGYNSSMGLWVALLAVAALAAGVWRLYRRRSMHK